MPGKSLAPWLTSESDGDGEGMAFCQFLETNSIFKPLHYGTVGVIQGRYQYVVLLSSMQGVLRPLDEAQNWTVDRSADHPERAAAMRAAINARFPGILQKPA